MRFSIGEIVVDVIVDDDDYPLPLSYLPRMDVAALAGHRAALEPEFLDLARGRLRVAVQSFVLRVGGRTVLIDSCIGDDRDRPQVGRTVIPAHFRGQRRAHVRRMDNAFEPIFPGPG